MTDPQAGPGRAARPRSGRCRRLTWRRRLTGDPGFSLVELMVNMTLMGMVGAIFTTAIVQTYRAANTVDTMAQTQTQIRLALQRLDTEIRYAYDITVPSTPEEATANSGTWYAEFVRVDAQSGTQECNQLRLQNGVLVLRSWTSGSSPSTTGAALASSIDMSVFATSSGAAAVVPFALQDAGSTPLAPSAGASPAVGASFSPDFQRLRLRLVTVAGARRLSSDITFTALNTTRTIDSTTERPTADICQDEGRP